jgi:hypothetical protein
MRAEPSGIKQCGGCRQHKSLAEFTKEKSRPDGLCSICKDCIKVRRAGRVPSESTKEKARLRAQRRAAELNKVQAKHKVQAAVRSGRLTPWPMCSVPECNVSKTEAHHPDYTRPLDVVWLCRSHHRLAHYAIRDIAARASAGGAA